MTQVLHCSGCDSANVWLRKHHVTDVFATWVHYAFLTAGIGNSGAAAPVTDEEVRFDLETHRVLATPRFFWRCRDCGEKGAVFDDYVTER